MNRKSKIYLYLKRSCITGNVVWVYHGHSSEGCRQAYLRACKKEIRRFRQWSARMAERKQALTQFLNLCCGGSCSSSSLAEREDMTPEQRAAAREILRMIKHPPLESREFYDHIVEESRRRNERSGRWKENRQKMVRYGKCK